MNNELDQLKINEESDKPPSLTKNKRSNSFVGTAQYVAPEILQSKAVHRGSDLWALGCVVFQLITGKHLFTGKYVLDKLK